MSIIHHWFESIHPFYDGNGRVGRILNILYLVSKNLLDSPVIYLSQYILKNKMDYYSLLQKVRQEERWEDWILYMLEGVAVTAQRTTKLIEEINILYKEYKRGIREKHKFYSQDLLNNIFNYPYTQISSLMRDLNLSRTTATRFLDALAKDGSFLDKHKKGRENYYMNTRLFKILKEG